MTVSYGGAVGTLAGALAAGYTLQAGDEVQALDGGPIFTVESIGGALFGSTPARPGVAAQSGLVLPTNGELISSASGEAFFSTSITGGGSVSATAITNGPLWDPADGPYTVTFSSSSAWTVENAASTEIASGTGATVTFRGVSITVTSPANGTVVAATPTWSS